MRPLRLVLALALLCWCVQPAQAQPTPHEGFGVGDFVPGLQFTDMNTGKLRSLHEFRGRKILLIEFASW